MFSSSMQQDGARLVQMTKEELPMMLRCLLQEALEAEMEGGLAQSMSAASLGSGDRTLHRGGSSNNFGSSVSLSRHADHLAHPPPQTHP